MENWTFGAINAEAGNMARLLAHIGVEQPLDEATAFGLGGGIAFGWFTFEYKGLPPSLYIGTRSNWHDPEAALTGMAQAAGAELTRHTASTEAAAEKKLQKAMEEGNPLLVCIDERAFSGPDFDTAQAGNQVYPLLLGIDGGEYILDYLSSSPHRLTAETFQKGRAAMKRAKYEFYSVNKAKPAKNLAEYAREAIAKQTENPLHPGIRAKGAQARLGFKGLQGFLTALTAEKGKHTLRSVGATRDDFASLMEQTHYWIAEAGTGGDGLRGLYSQFLAVHGSGSNSRQAAELFVESAGAWREIARAARNCSEALAADQDFEDHRQAALQEIAGHLRVIIDRETKAFELLSII